MDLLCICLSDNCGENCVDYYDSVAHWKSPGIGRGLLFMCLQFVLYSALLFFLESGVAKRLKNKIFASMYIVVKDYLPSNLKVL